MIDVSGILTLVVPSTIASFVTYLVTKKKYNAEVDSNVIENMKASLTFYQSIIDDNKERIEYYTELAEENRKEIQELRRSIQNLLKISCIDNTCPSRQLVSGDNIEQYTK